MTGLPANLLAKRQVWPTSSSVFFRMGFLADSTEARLEVSEVSEGAFAGEDHAYSMLIAGFDEFWVFDRAAWLDNR